jgi:methanogenic corrinoid protein MtbC1
MQPINRTPIYNLKAVLRETGLTADVLRAWERRYGLPQPQRTQGRQRLYSQYDIALVKWLKARQAEGLSISRAVEQWKETVGAGREPLTDYSSVGSSSFRPPLSSHDTQKEILSTQWIEACLNFDETIADQALNQAFSLYSVEMVCTEFIQHGLSLIGDRWYLGEASVQQEHFATALASRRLETLIASTPPPTRKQTVLVGCPAGEFHSFPALLLTLFLRRKGFNLVYLGADVPSEWMTEAISAIRPELVVIAAQRLTTAASLRQLAARLQASGNEIAYGGWIFNRIPALRERIPAHFLGETIASALEKIDVLTAQSLPAPQITPNPDSLVSATRAFREQRASIEAEVFASMESYGLSTEQIIMANNFFGADLTAALELGEPSALTENIKWIRTQMVLHHISPDHLSNYLHAYQQAIQKVLGAESEFINSYGEN